MVRSKKVPRRLYKYRAFSNLTLQLLIADNVFFADPNEFNDPLDSKPNVEIDLDVRELEAVLMQLVTESVSSEMTSAANAIKYRGPKTREHIAKQGRHSAENLISNIRYNAADPEYDEAEHHVWLLQQNIETELLRRYNRGIMSLAERAVCPLMWSHYADQHKGVCIGYSVPADAADQIERVQYRGGRNVKASDVATMLKGDLEARQRVDRCVLTRKAPEWQYEREWRLLGDRGLQNCPLELEEVIFGLRCETPVMYSIVKALKGRTRSVRFYEICEKRGTFALQKRSLDSAEMLQVYPRRHRDILEAFSIIPKSTSMRKRAPRQARLLAGS